MLGHFGMFFREGLYSWSVSEEEECWLILEGYNEAEG